MFEIEISNKKNLDGQLKLVLVIKVKFVHMKMLVVQGNYLVVILLINPVIFVQQHSMLNVINFIPCWKLVKYVYEFELLSKTISFSFLQVYFIAKASLKAANRQFNNTNNDYEMTFNHDTIIEACDVGEGENIPQVQFNFIPISEIANRAANTMCGTLISF